MHECEELHKSYLFMDESYSRQPNGGFTVIAILSVTDRDALAVNWREYEKEVKAAGFPRGKEVKAATINNVKAKHGASLRFVKQKKQWIAEGLKIISENEARIFYGYYSNDLAPISLFRHRPNEFYNQLAAKTIECAFNSLRGDEIILTVDERDNNPWMQGHFDGYISTYISTNIHYEYDFDIRHKRSHNVTELRPVDFCAWALRRFHETGEQYYVPIVRDKILSSARLF